MIYYNQFALQNCFIKHFFDNFVKKIATSVFKHLKKLPQNENFVAKRMFEKVA